MNTSLLSASYIGNLISKLSACICDNYVVMAAQCTRQQQVKGSKTQHEDIAMRFRLA